LDFDHARGLKRDTVAHLGTLDFIAEKGNIVPRPNRHRQDPPRHRHRDPGLSQPRRPGPAGVQLSADRADRRNAIRRQMFGGHLGRLLPKRVRTVCTTGRARRRLRTADDRHVGLLSPSGRCRRT
jgi:hypothetical protein